MRCLMWCTIGFAAACAVGAYLVTGNLLLILAPVCLLCAVPFFIIKATRFKPIGFIALGCAVGFAFNWCYQHFYLQDAFERNGQKETAVITASDYSYETNFGTAVDGSLTLGGKQYKVKAYLYKPVQIKPGDQITDEFTFRYTSVGAENDPTYHQGNGIYLLCYGTDEFRISASEEENLLDFPVKLRHSIGQQIDALFAPDVAGFAKALLIGDSSGMSYEDSSAFSVSGISHIIAVSGLHVSILCSVIAWLCWHKRYLTAVIGIPVLVLFAAVAGFTPSVVRACVMQAMVMLSMVLDKEYDPATALSAAVLFILLLNPLTVTSVSFQLSVACLIGIYGFSERIRSYFASRKWAAAAKGNGLHSRILRMAMTSVSISFSVWIITTPLCAIHFGMVSTVGILTNLVTVWLVSFIFYGIMLAVAISFAWLWLGSAVAWLTAWPMRFVQLVASLFSKIPYAAVYTSSPYILCWLILCYILLALFALFRYRKPVALLGCMIIGLVMACVSSTLAESRVTQRISILDVGQGQCVVMKYNDRYYMFDCGGSFDHDTADTAIEYLQSRGIWTLDGLILSHYDQDHAGAAAMLMSRVTVTTLYLPDMQPEDATRNALEEKYADRIHWVKDDLRIPDGNISLFFNKDAATDNESSICVLFQPENCDILIMSDRNISGENQLLESTSLPELEMLVVGNHGSKYATGVELLVWTKPTVAVISVGENHYGHPSDEVLELLEQFDCRVYRTDTMGTLEFGW